MLGRREPSRYGSDTLDDLQQHIEAEAERLGLSVSFFQSNHEGELIERIQGAPMREVDAIVLNAGAYTHTSVAIRDALLSVLVPFVEVHLTNVHQREAFRQTSFFADIALGQISGFGREGYALALRALQLHLSGEADEHIASDSAIL